MKMIAIKALCLLAFINGQAKAGTALDLASQFELTPTYAYEQLDGQLNMGNNALTA